MLFPIASGLRRPPPFETSITLDRHDSHTWSCPGAKGKALRRRLKALLFERSHDAPHTLHIYSSSDVVLFSTCSPAVAAAMRERLGTRRMP